MAKLFRKPGEIGKDFAKLNKFSENWPIFLEITL
jgi:hypothetical protein